MSLGHLFCLVAEAKNKQHSFSQLSCMIKEGNLATLYKVLNGAVSCRSDYDPIVTTPPSKLHVLRAEL